MHDRIRVLLDHAHYPRLLPTYGADYRVHLGRGPAYDTPYTDETVTPCIVYWFGRDVARDFLHEMGHVLLDTRLDDRQREHVRRLVPGTPREKAQPWFWDRPPMKRSRLPDAFCEPAADAYADMQLHPHMHRELRTYLREELLP